MVKEGKPRGFKGRMLDAEGLTIMHEVIDLIRGKNLSVSMAKLVLEAALGEIQIEAMERKV